MSHKAKLLVVVPALLMILGVIFCGCSGANDRSNAKKENYHFPVQDIQANPDSKPEDFGDQTFSNVPEAERALGFKVKLPKKLANVAVKSVIVGDSAMGEPGVSIGYENGVLFQCYKARAPMDYAGVIRSMEAMSSQASVKPSLLPHVITIAGHQGMLWPPHTNVGDTRPGSADVYWSDNGFKYEVWSVSLPFSNEQAIAIAESVY